MHIKCIGQTLSAAVVQVIFTEPYTTASNNHWTSPQLDADVASLQSDVGVKAAVARLKERFCSAPQALLHGDMHTGSLMVRAPWPSIDCLCYLNSSF
jgi:5-methylthioribose kinase